jgi:hypothetical protein
MWEFYEWGGWKPCSEFVTNFLEEQRNKGAEICGMKLDRSGDKQYEWNLRDLLQKRKHRWPDGKWITVKTRSIRRVSVLAAPDHPVD